MLAKYIAVHFLVWLLIPLILIWYVGAEFFEFAVIGIVAVFIVDYVALRAIWFKYFPFALIGLLLAVIINYYII